MTMMKMPQLETIHQISITQKIHRMIVDMEIGIRIIIKSLLGTTPQLGIAEKLHGIITIRRQEVIIRQQDGMVEKLGTIIPHPLGIPLNLHGRLTHHKLSNLLFPRY
jgi:hypothetical protein